MQQATARSRLTAERRNAPDYTPTLSDLSCRLKHVEGLVIKVADSPAIRLTPENLAVSTATPSETTRAGDRESLDKAGATLRTLVVRIDGVVERAWTADRQNRLLISTGLAGALAGMLLGSIVPGEIARAPPATWEVPEKIAARVCDFDYGKRAKRWSSHRDHRKILTQARSPPV